MYPKQGLLVPSEQLAAARKWLEATFCGTAETNAQRDTPSGSGDRRCATSIGKSPAAFGEDSSAKCLFSHEQEPDTLFVPPGVAKKGYRKLSTSAVGEEMCGARTVRDEATEQLTGRLARTAGNLSSDCALRCEEEAFSPCMARTDFERKANRKLWTPRKVFCVRKISTSSEQDPEYGLRRPAGLAEATQTQLTSSVIDVSGRGRAKGRAPSRTAEHRSIDGVEKTSTSDKLPIYRIQHVATACRFREQIVGRAVPLSQTGPDCSSFLQREPPHTGPDENGVEAAADPDGITNRAPSGSAPRAHIASKGSGSEPGGERPLVDCSEAPTTSCEVEITDCKFVALTRPQWDFFFSCLMGAAHRTEKHEKGGSQPTAQADHGVEPDFEVVGKKSNIHKEEDRNGKTKGHLLLRLPESLTACVRLVELDVLDVDHDLNLKDYPTTASTPFADQNKNLPAISKDADGAAVANQSEVFPDASPAMSTNCDGAAVEQQASDPQLQPDSGKNAVHPTKATRPSSPQFTFVDLFAGIGGFSCGLKSGNFCHLRGTCLLASECDAEARFLYEVNHGKPLFGFNTDITTLERLPACPLTGQLDLLCAGFPCQSFSKAKYGSAECSDIMTCRFGLNCNMFILVYQINSAKSIVMQMEM